MGRDGTDHHRVGVALIGHLLAVRGEGGDQVGEVRGTSHVEIVDVLVVEDRVVADLRDGLGSVLPGLHVEHVAGDVGEAILVLVGQRGRDHGIVRGGRAQRRVGVVRQVVVGGGGAVGKAEEQNLDGHDEVELQTLLSNGALGRVGLLELLDDDIASLILMGGALIVRNQHVLGPVVGHTDLEGLVASHGQDGREVDASSRLVNPNRGIVHHISSGVLLDADQGGQVGLDLELLLDVVQRRAADGKRVARVTSVVEGSGQLDGRRRERGTEGLESSRVSDELLVESPLLSLVAVLRHEVEANRLVALDHQIVELERSDVPDVVGQIPGVGNAPGQLTVVGCVDRDGGQHGLNPRHQGEVSSLGKGEAGRIVGTVVLVGSEQMRVPTVLADLTGEEGGDLVTSVEHLIGLVVGGNVDVPDGDSCGGLRAHPETFIISNQFPPVSTD